MEDICNMKMGPCSKCGEFRKPCRCHLEAEIERLQKCQPDMVQALVDKIASLQAQLSEQFTEHERVVQLLFKTNLQLDEANLNYLACLADVKRYKKMLVCK